VRPLCFKLLDMVCSWHDSGKRPRWSIGAKVSWCLLCLLAVGEAKYDDGGLRGGLSGLYWSDWDGRQVCNPSAFSMPSSVGEIQDIILKADKVKVVGAGHSFSSIALSDGAHYISLDRFRKPLGVFSGDDGHFVRVQAGMRLFELNAYLEDHGYALLNLGATAEQSIAGAVATGTHGTGEFIGSISTLIHSIRLVDGTGKVWEASAERNMDLFNAARVGIGALGVVTELVLKVVPQFKLKQVTVSIQLDHMLKLLPKVMAKHERVQWFWFPYTGKNATLLIRDATDEPLTKGGCWKKPKFEPTVHEETGGTITSQCVDISYKALCDSKIAYHKRTLYTEMEMFIPTEYTSSAIQMFRDKLASLQAKHSEKVSVFTGVRYVGPDDIWLSPQYKRSNAVISFIVQGSKTETGDPQEFQLFSSELEKLTTAHFHGIPHWGKQNYADYPTLSKRYPKLREFNYLRRILDPNNKFMNGYLETRIGNDLVGLMS